MSVRLQLLYHLIENFLQFSFLCFVLFPCHHQPHVVRLLWDDVEMNMIDSLFIVKDLSSRTLGWADLMGYPSIILKNIVILDARSDGDLLCHGQQFPKIFVWNVMYLLRVIYTPSQ